MTPSQLGSIEFAVEELGTRLVVVLVHTHCGAVTATLTHLCEPTGDLSDSLRVIVDRIRPAVQHVPVKEMREDREKALRQGIRANIRLGVQQVRDHCRTLAHLTQTDDLLVVGAEYSLETGRVDFFDGAPP